VIFQLYVHGESAEWHFSVPLVSFELERHIYSAFFLTVAIGNCIVKLIPPVNFCSDENIQTIFATKLEDFLNYRIDYNSIS
jgi:hypothetical protein